MNLCVSAHAFGLLLLCGCTPSSLHPPAAQASETPAPCSVRFDEPDLPDPIAPENINLPPSEIVVGVAFDTAALTSLLAKEVPPRVAQDRNVDAGLAGKLSYQIDRSPFVASVSERRLVITTRLQGRADLCKPLGPLGCVRYAQCSPQALATASVPLSLGSSYRIGPASVSIRTTRPCEIGGIDATPQIQKEADVQARRIERRINGLLPSFSKDAQALWNAMGVHVPLGIDSRLRITPLLVVEGAPTQSGPRVTIPLGVRATVRIEPRHGERDDVGPIPSPVHEPELAPDLHLHVPIEVDLESIDAALSRSVREAETPGSKASSKNTAQDSLETRILSVRSRPDGTNLRVFVSVKGYSCGVLAFRGVPAYDQKSVRVHLSDVQPLTSEKQRAAQLDPGLDLHRIARILESRGTIPLPIDPSTIPAGLDRAVELLSPQDGPDVRMSVGEASVSRIAVTPTGLAAIVHVTGSAQIVLK